MEGEGQERKKGSRIRLDDLQIAIHTTLIFLTFVAWNCNSRYLPPLSPLYSCSLPLSPLDFLFSSEE